MWRSTAAAIAARSRSHSAVLPSMSVKRKVTVPEGRSGMIRFQCATCWDPSRLSHVMDFDYRLDLRGVVIRLTQDFCFSFRPDSVTQVPTCTGPTHCIHGMVSAWGSAMSSVSPPLCTSTTRAVPFGVRPVLPSCSFNARSESLSDRPFRFGVQLRGASSAQDWREKCRKVEALGYDTLLVADHFPRGLGAFTALASAAAVTIGSASAPSSLPTISDIRLISRRKPQHSIFFLTGGLSWASAQVGYVPNTRRPAFPSIAPLSALIVWPRHSPWSNAFGLRTPLAIRAASTM